MSKAYKIGTVETLRVNTSGRRFYLNLDAFTVRAYEIQAGDLLRVRIEEGVRPDTQGSDTFQKLSRSPKKQEEEEGE